MFVLGVIIVIIILLVNYNELKAENERLRQSLAKSFKFCPKCGYDLYGHTVSNQNICHEPRSEIPIVVKKEPVKIQKEKPTDKEIKNSLILIVGAVLIILSAIFFLTSTWNVSHNFVKTIIIILLFFVFYSASYIAEAKLNLKSTAKTFYYLSLAYIPIVFLSIALFGLLGNYLSLNGEGRYIYLFISSLITMFIYNYSSIKKKYID